MGVLGNLFASYGGIFHSFIAQTFPVGVLGNLFPWIFLNLWISRNKLMFENRSSTPQEIFLKLFVLWRNGNIPTQSTSSCPKDTTFNPFASISDDLCTRHLLQHWCVLEILFRGLAWIFSDHSGTELYHKSISLEHVSSQIMAEALAIRGALLHASSINITHICLWPESQALVQAISQRKYTMKLFGVHSDIESLSFSHVSPFSSCRFDFTPRTENRSADQLAKPNYPLM